MVGSSREEFTLHLPFFYTLRVPLCGIGHGPLFSLVAAS